MILISKITLNLLLTLSFTFRGLFFGHLLGAFIWGEKQKKANRIWSRLAFFAKLYFNLVRSLFGGAGLFFNVIMYIVRNAVSPPDVSTITSLKAGPLPGTNA